MARSSSRLQKVEPSLPHEPTRTRQKFRPALAKYFCDVAASLRNPNVFTLRGNKNWGLSFEFQISVREYSALLFGSELIKLKADGSVDVSKN